MNWIKQHPIKFVLILLVFLNIIFFIITFCIIYEKNTTTSAVNITVTPSDANILINNTNYSNGKYDFKPGEYTAIVSRDGFQEKTVQLSLQDGKTTDLQVYLSEYNGSFDYYKSHKADYYILKNIAKDSDKDVMKFFKDFNKITSIKNQLPMTDYVYEGKNNSGGFKIADGSNNDNCLEVFCLEVSYFLKQYPEQVKAKIKDLGYNPDNYHIIVVRDR